MPKNTLKNGFNHLKIPINDVKIANFSIFERLLLDWNEKINLTAITDSFDIMTKHFLDSLLPLTVFDIPKNARMIDVGTGAGFPGIPLKLARSDISVTLLDSLNKRINFLNEVVAELEPDIEPEVIDEIQILGEVFPDEPEGEPEYEADIIFQDACEATAFFHGEDDGVIELDDYNFATNVMNIVFGDAEHLLGRSFRYEGILWSFYWPITSRNIHNVIRYTDITGSGDYASIGLEIYYDGEMSILDGAWVEVVGVLERTYTEDGFLPVRLRVTSLVELDERGEEFVPPPVSMGGG